MNQQMQISAPTALTFWRQDKEHDPADGVSLYKSGLIFQVWKRGENARDYFLPVAAEMTGHSYLMQTQMTRMTIDFDGIQRVWDRPMTVERVDQMALSPDVEKDVVDALVRKAYVGFVQNKKTTIHFILPGQNKVAPVEAYHFKDVYAAGRDCVGSVFVADSTSCLFVPATAVVDLGNKKIVPPGAYRFVEAKQVEQGVDGGAIEAMRLAETKLDLNKRLSLYGAAARHAAYHAPTLAM